MILCICVATNKKSVNGVRYCTGLAPVR